MNRKFLIFAFFCLLQNYIFASNNPILESASICYSARITRIELKYQNNENVYVYQHHKFPNNTPEYTIHEEVFRVGDNGKIFLDASNLLGIDKNQYEVMKRRVKSMQNQERTVHFDYFN